MPPTTSIPRFLLPQRGAIWRTTRFSAPTSRSLTTIRKASSKSSKHGKKPPLKQRPSKPIVLEKPEKFNPPSHPQRLRKEAPRYPGPSLSQEEKARQAKKKYPNMMPPPGTFRHWFIHNKTIHLWISMGTLVTLACTVWVSNFKRNSPFADMLPAWQNLFLHPISFWRTFFEVVKLNGDHTTAETMARRKAKVEDVAKRAEYRKAHGMESDQSFGGWTAKTDKDMLGPGIPVGTPVAEDEEHSSPQVPKEKPFSGKKWLGIW